ncbi:MAG: hypothetical protein P4L46_23280 [Fimbriimonas sp.]|nr:hypothetical protein [Fimbriimonas sp.]
MLCARDGDEEVEMMVMLGAIAALGSGLATPANAIVFAACRYAEHLGNVYPVGSSHLYSIEADGTHLRQLTTGDSDDIAPSPSKSGGRILFWREQGRNEHAKFALCSIGFGEGSFQRSSVEIIAPTPGLAQAIERFGTRAIHPTSKSKGRGLTIVNSFGRAVVRDADLAFSPRGDAAIARISSETDDSHRYMVVDLQTMKGYDCPSDLDRLVWVDNKTISSIVPDGGRSIFLLNRMARKLRKIPIRDAMGPKGDPQATEIPFFDVEIGMGPRHVRSFPLAQKGTYLLQGYQSGSDGGFNYFSRVDLGQRRMGKTFDQSVEAVSPDGLQFIGVQYEWYGGYKGDGAKKLGIMYLWDSTTMTKRPIGFRYMECQGACFVPKIAGA